MRRQLCALLLAVLMVVMIPFTAFAATPTTWADVEAEAYDLYCLYLQYTYWVVSGNYITVDEAAQYMSDSALHWLEWSDTLGWYLCPYDDIYYYVVDGELWCYEGDITTATSGSGGKCRGDGGGRGKLRVTGDTFNDIVDRLNEQYGPEQKADRRVVSLQNPIHPSYSVQGLGWSNLSTGSASSRNCIPIRLGSDMLLGQDLREVWFFPFVDDADNGMVYYCGYQYRVYHFVNEDQTVSLMADAYNCVDASAAVTTYTLVEDLAKYPYVFVKMGYPEGTSNRGLFACFGFDSLTDFLKFYSPAQQKYIASVDMISSDNVLFSTVYDLIRADTFDPVDDGDDVGFITSQSKFNIGFMSTPLPDVTDNYYITINGDNIYEYIITNPDTGESTTIYNYITNNYYFPDDGDDGDDDVGGGSTTGDVTVGGTVKVDGDIDVGGKFDININITDDTGDAGTAESQPSYIDDKNVDLDAYLEKTPEIAEGFMDYMRSIMVYWLPADILGVMVLGIVVAVWCRLAGR